MVEKKWLESVVIYTDGACSGNPGPGGWAAIVVLPEGEINELGGGGDHVTNNRMELMGAIQGLRAVAKRDDPVVVFTDSTYVIRGITQWIWGWRRKGWKNAEGQDVLNKDLWEDLSRLVGARAGSPVEWRYIRGHTGNPGNERCDEIAVGFSQKRWVDLYKGPLVGYRVAVHDFPPEVPLPEMRPKAEKKAAFSYLSLLGGKPQRHRDWASCERRVKGQSGAKFKKAMSADDEMSILKEWGLDPSRLVDEG